MLIWIIGSLLILGLLGAILYWQLVVAEGAYLGRRVVTFLYDWFAPRYDRVKQFQPAMDTIMLAVPIMKHLARQTSARGVGEPPELLDVATGTGRLPQCLLAQRGFRGHITALDISARMLAQAQAKPIGDGHRVTWLQHDAQSLPFEDDHFDVVTCLEALEFFPHPRDAIHEMRRVLKPGGLILLSNRIGPDAWKLPGRAVSTAVAATWLEQSGFKQVHAEAWLIDYDLLRALK